MSRPAKLKNISNQDIAKILYEMAAMYEMQNVPFKPRAYEKAALGVENLDEEVGDRYKQEEFESLTRIPGVGQGIAKHIEELLKTGRLSKYEALRKKIPVNLSDLMSVEGVGPKTVKVLYQKLKIRSLLDLKRAADKHKIRTLPGFGQKSEEKILAALGFRSHNEGRFILGFIEPQVERLTKILKDSKLFNGLQVGGSYRRRQETIGDIDILATSENPKKAMDFFVTLPEASRILEQGTTKSEIILQKGPQVDLRIVPEASWGAALQYFTGDKSHNIKLRKIAIEKGLKLSEYGIFKLRKGNLPPLRLPLSKGEKQRGSTEEQVYKALGMDFIPPELRTDTGEIEAAQKHNLPKLINFGDVKGDLQVQTNWTDGSNSVEDMAKAAVSAGLEYIAITDHTKTLAMTGGLDERKLLQQIKAIDKLNAKLRPLTFNSSPLKRGEGQEGVRGFRILKGAEVNILKDGSLDIDDSVLAELDVVGVSIHTNMKMGRSDMTKRIVRALSNPNVDIFFHPTTRIINRRGPIDFDFSEILKAAKKYKVALEINAYPDRMDIHDTMIRQAVEAGVKLVINTDAHHTSHFRYLHLGEGQARRGWATKNDILNTRSVEEVLKYLGK